MKIWQYTVGLGYILAACICFGITPVKAQTDNRPSHAIPHYWWSFNKALGGYNLSSVQRGYLVYHNACASCHSIKEMRYADLQQTGLSLEQVDKVIHDRHVMDGKNAQGQDNYRPATVTDFLVSPYVNKQAAKAANMGKLPVDFSRYMIQGKNREDYVMALLMGYRHAPLDFKADPAGMVYNVYAPNQQIAMKNPLSVNDVRYGDGVNASVEQQARDVVTFLSWVSHPHYAERHRIGIMLFIYMMFIAVLAFLVKRRIWSNLN